MCVGAAHAYTNSDGAGRLPGHASFTYFFFGLNSSSASPAVAAAVFAASLLIDERSMAIVAAASSKFCEACVGIKNI